MNITTVGVDLAKSVFQIHGVDDRGKTVLRKQVKRNQLIGFFANLPVCLIGMEACCSAHFFARKLGALGHTVKLMAPQFVKPYVKTNKNDSADAEAICEAVARPNMRFVPEKTIEQQSVLALHRARTGFVGARTAQANQIRGLLAEFGIVFATGVTFLKREMPAILADLENGLTMTSRELFSRLFSHLLVLDRNVDEIEAQINAWHRDDVASRRLQRIPGVGPITASAIVASIGNARAFKNGRQLAAWIGLVPRQYSSGGKDVLLGISKRGDAYLRRLLVLGARTVLRHRRIKPDATPSWIDRVAARRHTNVAAVALANKNARVIWALLAHDREYRVGYLESGSIQPA